MRKRIPSAKVTSFEGRHSTSTKPMSGLFPFPLAKQNFPRCCLLKLQIFTDITNFARTDFSARSPLFIFFGVNHLGGATDSAHELILQLFLVLKDSAPLKLPTRNCLSSFFPPRLENISNKMAISLSSMLHPKTKP